MSALSTLPAILSLSDCRVEVLASQDWERVRGNACASGDDAEDRECENEILRRLDAGDVWAWASVEVRVSFGGQSASAYLGCCCYADEADFRAPGGYFDDLAAEALAELTAKIDQSGEH